LQNQSGAYHKKQWHKTGSSSRGCDFHATIPLCKGPKRDPKRDPKRADGVAVGKKRGRGPVFSQPAGKSAYFSGLFSVLEQLNLELLRAGNTLYVRLKIWNYEWRAYSVSAQGSNTQSQSQNFSFGIGSTFNILPPHRVSQLTSYGCISAL
jgi:hypothetical protein